MMKSKKFKVYRTDSNELRWEGELPEWLAIKQVKDPFVFRSILDSLEVVGRVGLPPANKPVQLSPEERAKRRKKLKMMVHDTPIGKVRWRGPLPPALAAITKPWTFRAALNSIRTLEKYGFPDVERLQRERREKEERSA